MRVLSKIWALDFPTLKMLRGHQVLLRHLPHHEQPQLSEGPKGSTSNDINKIILPLHTRVYQFSSCPVFSASLVRKAQTLISPVQHRLVCKPLLALEDFHNFRIPRSAFQISQRLLLFTTIMLSISFVGDHILNMFVVALCDDFPLDKISIR